VSVPSHWTVQLAPVPQSMLPAHENMPPQLTVQRPAPQLTLSPHAEVPHMTSQSPLAGHVMGPWHANVPLQSILHAPDTHVPPAAAHAPGLQIEPDDPSVSMPVPSSRIASDPVAPASRRSPKPIRPHAASTTRIQMRSAISGRHSLHPQWTRQPSIAISQL
jgi:hypothetical protein